MTTDIKSVPCSPRLLPIDLRRSNSCPLIPQESEDDLYSCASETPDEETLEAPAKTTHLDQAAKLIQSCWKTYKHCPDPIKIFGTGTVALATGGLPLLAGYLTIKTISQLPPSSSPELPHTPKEINQPNPPPGSGSQLAPDSSPQPPPTSAENPSSALVEVNQLNTEQHTQVLDHPKAPPAPATGIQKLWNLSKGFFGIQPPSDPSLQPVAEPPHDPEPLKSIQSTLHEAINPLVTAAQSIKTTTIAAGGVPLYSGSTGYQLSLPDIRGKILDFKRRQPQEFKQAHSRSKELSDSFDFSEAVKAPNAATMQKTKETFENCVNNLKHFTHLSILFSCTHLKYKYTFSNIHALLPKESKANAETLTALFLKKYRKDLNLWHRLKIAMAHWLLSSRFFDKTVEAYSNHIYCELRTHLFNGQWTGNKKIITQMIQYSSQIFTAFITGTKEFAKVHEKNGTSTPTDRMKYRDKHFESLFGDTTKNISRTFSNAVLQHLLPSVVFFEEKWFFNRMVNGFANWILKRLVSNYLPTSNESLISLAKTSTSSTSLPFRKALIDTVHAQLIKLLKVMDNPSHSSGSQNKLRLDTEPIKELVNELLKALDYGKMKADELSAKINGYNQSDESHFRQMSKEGIRETIQEGCVLLLNYLSDPDASTEMFWTFFDFVNSIFDANQQEVTQEAEERATTDLTDQVQELGQKIAKDAVKKAFPKKLSEEMEKKSEAEFATLKENTQVTSSSLSDIAGDLSSKINALKPSKWEPENDIRTLLEKIVANIENVRQAIEQIKQIPGLTKADIEGILSPLSPVCDVLNQILDRILELQARQNEIQATNQAQKAITKFLECLTSNTASLTTTKLMDILCPELDTLRADLIKILPSSPEKWNYLKENRETIFGIAKESEELHQKIQLLEKIKTNVDFFHEVNSSPSQKREANKWLLSQLNDPEFSKDAENLVLIQLLNKATKNKENTTAIFNLITQIDKQISTNKTVLTETLNELPLQHLNDWLNQTLQDQIQSEELIIRKVKEGYGQLTSFIDTLNTHTHDLVQRKPIHLNDTQLQFVGGTLAATLALIAPSWLAGVLIMGTKLSPTIIRSIVEKQNTQALLQGAGAAAAGAFLNATLSSIPVLGPVLTPAIDAMIGADFGQKVMPECHEKAQELVQSEITKFFTEIKDFLLKNTEGFSPAFTKMFMKVISDALNEKTKNPAHFAE